MEIEYEIYEYVDDDDDLLYQHQQHLNYSNQTYFQYNPNISHPTTKHSPQSHYKWLHSINCSSNNDNYYSTEQPSTENVNPLKYVSSQGYLIEEPEDDEQRMYKKSKNISTNTITITEISTTSNKLEKKKTNIIKNNVLKKKPLTNFTSKTILRKNNKYKN